MPRQASTRGRTKLAKHRLMDGLTQQQMADWSGTPIGSYRRSERGERIPSLPELVNYSIILGVPLDDLIEDDWLQWHQLSADAAKPPTHHWRPWHKLGRRPPEEFLAGLSPQVRQHVLREWEIDQRERREAGNGAAGADSV